MDPRRATVAAAVGALVAGAILGGALLAHRAATPPGAAATEYATDASVDGHHVVGANVPIPAPADAGTVLTSNGPGAISSWNALPGAAQGWVTALDCDLTAQGGQTFTANQSYTVCGVSAQKQNTLATNGGTSEIDAAALIPGTGLRFDPGNHGGYPGIGGTGTGSNFGLPRLFFPLAPLVPGLDWHTAIRVWIEVTAEGDPGANAAGIGTFIGVDDCNVQPNATTAVTGCVLERGRGYASWVGFSVATWCMFRSEINNVMVGNRFGITDLDANANNMQTTVFEIDSLGALTSFGNIAAASGSWPSNAATQRVTTWGSTGQWNQASPTYSILPQPASSYGVFVGAGNDGSGSPNSFTYSRIRIDYRL